MSARPRGRGRGRGTRAVGPPIGDDIKPGGAVRVATTQKTSIKYQNGATTTTPVSASQFADVQPETTQPQEKRKYTVMHIRVRERSSRHADPTQPLLKPVKVFHL